MKVLVTGSNGQVGWEVVRAIGAAAGATDIEVVALDRATLDLQDIDRLVSTVREVDPRIIVNAAAYTAVDRAEAERDQAFAVNAHAVGILAEEARRSGAMLIHYSTDYVFDGRKTEPYVEEDEPNPVGCYGASKLAGERAIEGSGCRYLVLRVSWIYSARRNNFLLKMVHLLGELDEVRVVRDQVGAPTSARLIGEITAHAALREQCRDAPEGTLHLAAVGETSWFGFASMIAAHRGRRGISTARLVPVSTQEFAAVARRPANSRMSCVRLEKAFGVTLPNWIVDAERCLDELQATGLEAGR